MSNLSAIIQWYYAANGATPGPAAPNYVVNEIAGVDTITAWSVPGVSQPSEASVMSHEAAFLAANGSAAIQADQATDTVMDATVTLPKLADLSGPERLLGRGELGAGPTQEIIVGDGLLIRGVTLQAALRGFIDGLLIRGNPGYSVEIYPGLAADTATWQLMYFPGSGGSSWTKYLNGTWIAGNSQPGLDVGTALIANTWYHCWLIKRSDTGHVDILWSLSSTAPTMPSGYDHKRRIGSLFTDNIGNPIPFTQFPDGLFLFRTPINNVFAAALNNTSALYSVSVPGGIKALWEGCIAVTGPAANIVTAIRCPDLDDAAGLTTAEGTVTIQGNGLYNYLQTSVMTNASSQVRCRSNGNVTQLFLTTRGWRDPRGKDA